MEIKFGLKLWSINSDLLNKANELIENDVFQYIELTPIPDTEITPFLEVDVPYVIHITTERHGVNIADRGKKKFNLRIIKNCFEWADKLNAKYLILHPGFGLIDDTIDFLEGIDDKRVLIENMPKIGLNNEKMVGYTPKQIKRLMNDKLGFCLDFGHAIKSSVSLDRDYIDFINEFLELKPVMFHLSDGDASNEMDEHMSLGEGNLDLHYFVDCIIGNKSRIVTLETPHHNNLEEDKKNILYLKRLIEE
ncbi:MAG: hypothetical protein B6U72_07205 [Candidatus Altiarchaeales archaeon ex4484_2]|nr:MAG: hypothetical protein B6U72_07205 [Candidatus Altiarchaeales archaeon ex4484_2]